MYTVVYEKVGTKLQENGLGRPTHMVPKEKMNFKENIQPYVVLYVLLTLWEYVVYTRNVIVLAKHLHVYLPTVHLRYVTIENLT